MPEGNIVFRRNARLRIDLIQYCPMEYGSDSIATEIFTLSARGDFRSDIFSQF